MCININLYIIKTSILHDKIGTENAYALRGQTFVFHDKKIIVQS